MVAERRLRRRLDVLAALGEMLAAGRPAVTGNHPLGSILTVLRAVDAIQRVKVSDRSVQLSPRPAGTRG